MPLHYLVPSVDWMSVSCPSGIASLLVDDLRPIVSAVPGSCAMSSGDGWYLSDSIDDRGSGIVQRRSHTHSPVSVISASGIAVSALRDAGLWSEYLRVFASDSHRVTRLDVALDVLVPAPGLLQSLYKRASSGEVALTRKALNPARHLRSIMSPGVTGEDTGTIYLGGKTAEVKARVYDKRHERIASGFPDPGPWLRAELTVTAAVGISLKDAWEPAPVFWHFMTQALDGIISRPVNVATWVPGGIGFDLPKRPRLDPVTTLTRRLRRSTELVDLCGLARSVRGGSVLVHQRLRELGIASLPSLGFIPSFLTAAANDGSA